jgi:hypothetical protein
MAKANVKYSFVTPERHAHIPKPFTTGGILRRHVSVSAFYDFHACRSLFQHQERIGNSTHRQPQAPLPE